MPSFWEKIQVDGQDMDLYASVPSGSGPFSAIVVSQHGGGVDTFIQNICDRFAEAGYAAVAPNLYHRVSDDVLNGDPRPRPWDVLSDPEIVADVNATVDFLRSHPAIDSEKLGITGFCNGRARGLVGGGNQPPLQGPSSLLRGQPDGNLGGRRNSSLRIGGKH